MSALSSSRTSKPYTRSSMYWYSESCSAYTTPLRLVQVDRVQRAGPHGRTVCGDEAGAAARGRPDGVAAQPRLRVGRLLLDSAALPRHADARHQVALRLLVVRERLHRRRALGHAQGDAAGVRPRLVHGPHVVPRRAGDCGVLWAAPHPRQHRPHCLHQLPPPPGCRGHRPPPPERRTSTAASPVCRAQLFHSLRNGTNNMWLAREGRVEALATRPGWTSEARHLGRSPAISRDLAPQMISHPSPWAQRSCGSCDGARERC